MEAIKQQQNISNAPETFKLWWIGEKKNFPAGVAFYDERFGEYSLKMDMHPVASFYLKPTSWESDTTYYKVEVAIKRGGKFKFRRLIGDAFSESIEGNIQINLWAYEKQLVLGEINHE